MSLPENLAVGPFIFPPPPPCPECKRLHAALAERDREVESLRRRLADAERRVVRERSQVEPREGN